MKSRYRFLNGCFSLVAVAASAVGTGAAMALLPRYTMAPSDGGAEALARVSVRRVLAELVAVAEASRLPSRLTP